ncbi:MAG TPA: hypothetical protein VE967_11305 [Gemmatimonadaceae bacterium]|nr:hypothetical protein [Gemmatimonadaceae bacterium]
MLNQSPAAGSSSPTPTSLEPAGAVLITERDFSCISGAGCAPGWNYSPDPSLATPAVVMLDPTAPRSPVNITQINFPAGFASGSAPATFEYPFRPVRTLYTCMWIKFSAQWMGAPTGANRIAHYYIGGGNRLTLNANGAGAAQLVPTVALLGLAARYDPGNGSSSTNVDLAPNLVPSAPLQRDLWHKFETLFVGNTPSVADGSVTVALNGTNIIAYNGITFVGAGTPGSWDDFQWGPLWGGFGGIVANPMWIAVDHIRLSGL